MHYGILDDSSLVYTHSPYIPYQVISCSRVMGSLLPLLRSPIQTYKMPYI